MAISAVCTVNGGASSSVTTVSAGSTVTIALADAAGVDVWTLSCIGTDDLNVAATVTSGLSVVTPTSKSYTQPSTNGCALLFRSTVVGRNGDTATSQFLVDTLTTSTLHVAAINETSERSATYGWISLLNSVARSSATIADGTVTRAKLSDASACSVIGRSANSTGVPADIQFASNDHVLKRTSNAISSGFVVNANVDAAAAIAGSKIAPDFGAQNVTTTGAAILGSSPAATGTVRLPQAGTVITNDGGTDRAVVTCAAGIRTFGEESSGQTFVKGVVATVQSTSSNMIELQAGAKSNWFSGVDIKFGNSVGTAKAGFLFSPLATGAAYMKFGQEVTSGLITGVDNTTNSATAVDITSRGINATGTTSTGGSYIIGPGTGTSANGKLKIINARTQTTVGAAGGASALPATPTKYLEITGPDGTDYVVPLYAKS